MATLIISAGQVSSGRSISTTGAYSKMEILGGGTAVNTTLTGQYVSNTSSSYWVKGIAVLVSQGGLASKTTVKAGTNIYVGGRATSTTVLSSGHIYVESGGTADKVFVSSCGQFYVSGGGSATNVSAYSGAWMRIDVTSNTLVSGASAGSSFAIKNGIVSKYTIGRSSYLNINSGCTANSITISPQGYMRVYDNGAANSVTISSGGSIYVSSGGKLTGQMVFSSGAVVSVHSSSIFDFNISDIAPGAAVRVNDLSLKTGTPIFTLTVSDSQTNGIYSLAGGASGFSNTRTISVVNTAGTTLGTLTINSPLETSTKIYTLSKTTNNTLTLQVRSMPVSGRVIENETVTVSAYETYSNTTVNAGGRMNIKASGLADVTTINSGGSTFVSSGGIVSNMIVSSGDLLTGGLQIAAGGSADNVTVKSGGRLSIDGTGTGISVESGGKLILGVALGTNIAGTSNGSAFEVNNGVFSNYAVDFTVNIGSGGTLSDIKNNGTFWISSGGTAINTELYPGGSIWINSGGTAINVVNSGGGIVVSGGGTAIGLVVSKNWLVIDVTSATYVSGTSAGSAFEIKDGVVSNYTLELGGLRLYSGCTANNVTLNSAAQFFNVYANAIANNTTVNSFGWFYISSGGTANNTTVNNYGRLFISSGGKLTGRTSIGTGAGAIVSAYEGAILDFNISDEEPGNAALFNNLSLVSGWSNAVFTLTVSGSEASGDYALADGAAGFDKTITVRNTLGEDLGTLTVDQSANIAGVDYTLSLLDGILSVTRGTMNISGHVIESGGSEVVSADVIYSDTTVNSDGTLNISSGGIADSTTINAGGTVNVSDGGLASNTTVNSDGTLNISSGGTADVTTINAGGTVNVSDGGLASNTTVNSDGTLNISSGGTADVTTINAGGTVNVSDGGLASNTTVNSDGTLNISYGGVADSTTISAGGMVNVSSGGLASNTTVNSDGTLNISSGGTADVTMINAGGLVNVSDGGLASNTTVNSDGTLTVFNGGIADITAVSSGGSLCVSSGGTATNITASSGAWLGFVVAPDTWIAGTSGGSEFSISSGFVSGYEITSGYLVVSSGGVAFDTTVNIDGMLGVASGGKAVGVTVNPGGSLYLSSGGTATGQITIVDGAIVSAFAGAVIDFDISDLAPGAAPRVNKLSLISGWADANYTLTVSETQDEGEYQLAGGATGFNKTLTVWNTLGTSSGTLAMGGSLIVGETFRYILDLDGEFLTLTIEALDLTPPTVSNIQASTTLPTNQNVVVTAEFSDDVELAASQYRIGEGGEWTAYTDGVTVSENTTVYFKAIDAAGNKSEVASIVVDNIDKVAPEKPTAVADITDPTNQDVTVTATFSDDSAVKEYSLDNQTWNAYTTGITLADNGTVYFRGTDAAGNESEVASIVVDNIDKVAPEKPTAVADIIGPTNQDVTVTATFSDDSAVKEYSLDNQTWNAYTTGIKLSENGTAYFRGTDEAGNESEVASIDVDNIDKVAPEKPTTFADITYPTNQDVTVTATFSDDSVVKEYSLDNQTWDAYTTGITLTENGTVYFRGTDEAGNESEVASIDVDNIDKVAPEKPTASADIIGPTNQDVTVTATFSDDSAVKEYSLDNQTWVAYTTGVTLSENGTVYFRGTDAAGNPSDVTGYTVSNIDKIAPEKPTASADITNPTNQDVTVTATFSADSVVQEYSLDEQTWGAYTAGVTLSENGTVYFRGTDAAGNKSETAEYTVSNIIKTMPTLTFANREWAEEPQGAPVTIDGITAYIGLDAFADGNDALVGVSAGGTVRVVGGSVSFGGVVDRNLVVDAGATLAGTAEFADDLSIRIDGTISFDSAYATATDAQFANFTVVCNGISTLAAVEKTEEQAGKSYLLATNAGSLSGSMVRFGEEFIRIGSVNFFRNDEKLSYVLDFKNVKSEDGVRTKNLVLSLVDRIDGADKQWNNYVYNKKLGGPNKDLDKFVDTLIDAGVSDILLDTHGSVLSEDGKYYNVVGKSDKLDYARITLDDAARLSFNAEAQYAATLTVYSLVTGVNKKKQTTYTFKKLKSVSLKKSRGDVTYTAALNGLLLDRTNDNTEYYISIKSTNGKVEKNFYNVSVNQAQSTFYYDSDEGDNNFLYDSKTKQWNDKLLNAEALFLNCDDIGQDIQIDDTTAEQKAGYNNFVGFGDAMDFRKIKLSSAAKLSFDVKLSGGTGKFFLYTINSNGKVKTITKKTFKSNDTTKELVLDSGEYYIAMSSVNAKKGDEVYYNVNLSKNTVFYVDGDGGTNNFDSKTRKVDASVDAISATKTLVQGETLQIDGAIAADAVVEYMDAAGKVYTNFVGTGDESDIVRIQANAGMKVSLKVTATDAVRLVVYGLQNNGTLKALKTVKSKNNVAELVDFELKAKSAPGRQFYIGVASINAKKGSAAYYNCGRRWRVRPELRSSLCAGSLFA